jgi:hypothetical protein
MARKLSSYLRDALVNEVVNGTNFVPPTDLYASLHDGDPGLTGANEVAGGGYARQLVTFAASAAGEADSDVGITFSNMPAVTVSWGGLWDAAVGGNFLAAGEQNPKAVPAGDDFVLDAGDLTFKLE